MTTAVLDQSKMKFVTLQPFREAAGVTFDKASRTARTVIITEGLGNLRDKNYYTREAVESAVKTFEGKQFFIDHPSESEEDDRPERSIYDLAGWFSNCEAGYVKDEESGDQLRACYANLRFDTSDAGETAMAKVEAALLYQKQYPNSKDVYAGISINGGGVSKPGTIKGMDVNLVTEIQEAFSADIVTKPARGGRFLALVKEAAKAAAWSRSQAQQGRTATPRMGAGGGRQMATVVKKGSREARQKVTQDTVGLLREVKALKRQIFEAKASDELESVKEVATEKLKAAGLKFAKTKQQAEAAGANVADILMDIQQDIGELSKSMGMGGAAEDDPAEIPEGDVVPEGEDVMQAEKEKAEKEATEKEAKEKEAREKEAKEKEATEKETEVAETEDEKEAGEEENESEEAEEEQEEEQEEEADDDEAEAFGKDEEDPEDEQDLGMGDDEEAGGTDRMQFKCAKCESVNEVAPPKGYMLTKAGETNENMGESERALRGRIRMIERQLEAKEGRFVKTNRNLAKALQENRKLKAKVIAFDRLEEATKKLKEANIPADILPPKDLVTLYEPEQWPAAIRGAKNMLTRESKLGQRRLAPTKESGGMHGSGKDGEVTAKDMVGRFTESYTDSKRDD